MRIPIDMEVAIDPEKNTVSIALYDMPIEHLENILKNIAEPEWRQNIIDGINGAKVAKDMGIPNTERTFKVVSEY